MSRNDFLFHYKTNNRVPGVEIIKEHERVFLVIEQTKGVINIASMEQN